MSENKPIELTGLVLEHVGRQAVIVLKSGLNIGETIQATSSSDSFHAVVGDLVFIEKRVQGYWINGIAERKNILQRVYFKTLRALASNIDLLVIVCASQPSFQHYSLDCMLTIAAAQNIPTQIIGNKIDLPEQKIQDLLLPYSEMGYDVLYGNATNPEGIPSLKKIIHGSDHKAIAFCGLSGVGKSTLINSLVPGACQETGVISQKRSLGKQTTSKARGFLFGSKNKLLIDLPGVQYFGVSHIAKDIIAQTFPEFAILYGKCKFLNCSHTKEPECAIRNALAEKRISEQRYVSYTKMIEEIEENKKY